MGYEVTAFRHTTKEMLTFILLTLIPIIVPSYTYNKNRFCWLSPSLSQIISFTPKLDCSTFTAEILLASNLVTVENICMKSSKLYPLQYFCTL